MTLIPSRRALASMVVFVLAVASALGFYLLSAALSAQPPARAFAGWIGVIQPVSALDGGAQVRVNAQALTAGAEVNMAYGLTVCGHGAFSGFFLIGDDARLDKTTLIATPGTVRRLPDANLSVQVQADATTELLQSVQVFKVDFEHLPPCVTDISSQTYAGTGFRIQGQTRSPIVTHADGLIHGPTERWSMPYVGGLPGQGSNLGLFRISGGIQGDFVRPASFAANVDAGAIPIHMDLDQARPATTDEGRPSWYETEPVQATARVNDSARAVTLQRLVTIAAILFGIAGSMLAAIALEWLRPADRWPETRRFVSETLEPGPSGLHGPSTPLIGDPKRHQGWTKLWPLAVLASYLLGRRRRGRRRTTPAQTSR